MDAAKAKSSVDPWRYFEGVCTDSDRPVQEPVCLYLETTNRCNLLCTTCPRTYEELEPPADMSWKLFCSIVDQIPNLSCKVSSRRFAGLALRAAVNRRSSSS
jgi:hypothetical protein